MSTSGTDDEGLLPVLAAAAAGSPLHTGGCPGRRARTQNSMCQLDGRSAWLPWPQRAPRPGRERWKRWTKGRERRGRLVRNTGYIRAGARGQAQPWQTSCSVHAWSLMAFEYLLGWRLYTQDKEFGWWLFFQLMMFIRHALHTAWGGASGLSTCWLSSHGCWGHCCWADPRATPPSMFWAGG